MREITLKRGMVVRMREGSCLGWRNDQCISDVTNEIGEVSLFGHNEIYKTHQVEEVISEFVYEEAK